jgi:hypothetical protein
LERASDQAIGAAITAGYWFLWVRCPACRTTNAIDLRTLDRHRDAAVTSLIPALSCRSCRPNAPFAELVRLSRTSMQTKCGRSIGSECWGNETNEARVLPYGESASEESIAQNATRFIWN